MRLTLLLLALAAWMAPAAQLTPALALTSAPADIMPLLDRNTRLDMVDYYTNGMATRSANGLQGECYITDMTPASLTLILSPASSLEIALLPVKGDTIIALVETVATPGLDSQISFYDRSWHPLPQVKHFIGPVWGDWVKDRADVRTVTDVTPFLLTSYYIDPAEGTLTVSNNISSFLDRDTCEAIAPLMYPKLTYRWTGKKFVLARGGK